MKIIVVILPMVIINTHTHGRDMKQLHKTSVAQVLFENLSSGISIVIFMPNTDPPIISIPILDRYLRIVEKARKEVGTDYPQYVYFGVTDSNLGECALALQNNSVVGLKIYPMLGGKAVTTGTIGVENEFTIYRAFWLARECNKAVAIHPEDPYVIEEDGYHSIRAEVAYIKRILRIAELVPGVTIILCHITCKESMELIMAARKTGINVVPEVTPHHLWFTNDGENWNSDLDPVFYHCYNPLRSKEERDYLRQCLENPNIPIILGSDGAPHTKEEKLKGAAGIPSDGEFISVPVTLKIGHRRLAELLSWNAADVFNIRVPKTTLKPVEFEERADDLEYNKGTVINPYRGSRLLLPKHFRR